MTEHVKGRTCIQPSPPFPGYAFGVPREKGVHDIEVTAFAASIFDRWRKKGLSLRAIEELTGIKHSQVSNVHQLKVGLGTSGQRLLARLLHPDLPGGGFRGSLDALEAHAKKWYATSAAAPWRATLEARGLVPSASDPRYPNRAVAVDLARRAGVDVETLAEIREAALKRERDAPVKWWLLQILLRDQATSDGLLPGEAIPKDRT
jgi:transcriptional regulator with XRE-family HTH domain